MRLTPLWAAVLLLGSYAGSATAAMPQDTVKLHQRALAATCANCHGTEGRTTEGFRDSLAGRHAARIHGGADEGLP